MTQRINIVLDGENEQGYGVLSCGGHEFRCLGKYGYKYPKDSTINASDKDHNYFSKQFSCKLPWAIKLDGNKGVYIHECVTPPYDMSHGNSHGCINLDPEPAEWVYGWIQGRTRVVITYPW